MVSPVVRSEHLSVLLGEKKVQFLNFPLKVWVRAKTSKARCMVSVEVRSKHLSRLVSKKKVQFLVFDIIWASLYSYPVTVCEYMGILSNIPFL